MLPRARSSRNNSSKPAMIPPTSIIRRWDHHLRRTQHNHSRHRHRLIHPPLTCQINLQHLHHHHITRIPINHLLQIMRIIMDQGQDHNQIFRQPRRQRRQRQPQQPHHVHMSTPSMCVVSRELYAQDAPLARLHYLWCPMPVPSMECSVRPDR